MKRKNKAYDELNRTHYSVLQNVCYCLKNTVQCYAPLLLWCTITILANVALPVLSTYLPKIVIDKITGKSSLQELITVVLAFTICIALLSGIIRFFREFIFRQKFRMNTFYLKRAALKGLTTDYGNQENGIFRKLQTESFACCYGYYSPLSNIYDTLIALLTGIFGLSVYWVILAQLNLWLILFLIITTAVSYALNQRILAWMAEHNPERIHYQQRLNYINATAGDIRSAKDIRLYRMAAWFSDIYKDNMQGLAGWYRRLTGKLFGVAVWDSGFALLREIAAYAYLLWLVWNHQISVADFVLYFGVITGFSSWLGGIFSQIASLNQLSLKINYFRSYLEYPESYKRQDGKSVPADGLPKVIELKNVSYRYEGSGQDALRNINLKITPGEHLAIVGLNGAGKTTLVKLLCGLIEPTEGQVLYDGVDIREYNRTEFYRLFSAVFQQFSILPVTIEEIVSETPSEALDPVKVERCLKAAGLWDKVKQLPQGVKSQFGRAIYEEGIEFSGGEVQKLLLARALYKSAPVMVLDEPTAALDPIAESTLYENYNQICEAKTAVFISHRLASTSFCHRTILIEDGVICEEGTHAGLLAQKGTYYHLFEMQAKYYRENANREVSE